MSQSARVTSIDAVAEFKQAIRQFEDDMRDSLMTLQLESQRALDWIDNDRSGYWFRQVRRADERLNESRNNLERAQLSLRPEDKPSCYQEKKQVALAKERQRYTEEQVQVVRQWQRRIQHEIDIFRGKLGRIEHIVDSDMSRAVATLERVVLALDRYAERKVPQPSGDRTVTTSDAEGDVPEDDSAT